MAGREPLPRWPVPIRIVPLFGLFRRIPAMPLKPDTIRRFLERYGTALSAGDGAAIAACWDTPALVLADDGARAVATLDEVQTFFNAATEHYRSQGLEATTPEVLKTESLSERLAMVEVRWHALDGRGERKSSERSRYLLRAADDGEPRIHVAIIEPA
jgi:ketosteroid isomerase-like protein